MEQKDIIKAVARSLAQPFRYGGKMIRIKTLIENELRNFAHALEQNQIYMPYQYPWSHFNKKKSRFLD